MELLQKDCFFSPYTKDVASVCEPFSCGDHDMDEFFKEDAFEYALFKMGRSYCFRLIKHPVIVDALNDKKTLGFYMKNDFTFLFSSESQEDIYTNPPKDELEKSERIKNPLSLKTRIMYFDLLDW